MFESMKIKIIVATLVAFLIVLVSFVSCNSEEVCTCSGIMDNYETLNHYHPAEWNASDCQELTRILNMQPGDDLVWDCI